MTENSTRPILKVVAGTEYREPAHEVAPSVVPVTKKPALALSATDHQKEQLAKAREHILALSMPTAGMTVQSALLWMRSHMDDEDASDRWSNLMVELAGYGVRMLPPHESGTVLGVLESPTALFKQVPQLKVFAEVLPPGTDLYRRVR